MSTTGQASRVSARPPLTVADAIKRGFDSAIANWPLLLLRLAEAICFGLLMVVGIVAIIVPIAISIGLSKLNLRNADHAAELVRSILVEHWAVFVYVLIAIVLALVVLVAIHSFVIAGVARVFVNAERAAGRDGTPRQRFAVFSIETWIAGGRDAWWQVFWLYNIAYGYAGIVLLLPLLPIALVILVFQAAPAALVASCLALILFAFLAIIVLVLTSIICQKAIVLAARRPYDGMTALRAAWRVMRADFGRHFGVAFIMMVITFGGTGALTMVSLGLSAPGAAAPAAALVLMPLRLGISLVSSVFSAAVSNWFIASFAALSAEEA